MMFEKGLPTIEQLEIAANIDIMYLKVSSSFKTTHNTKKYTYFEFLDQIVDTPGYTQCGQVHFKNYHRR